MLNVEIVIHNELARFIALKREPSAPSEKLLRFVERSAEASVEKLLLVALDGDAVEKQPVAAENPPSVRRAAR